MKIYWREPTSARHHPAVAALRAWFDSVSPLQQDLLLRHVCAQAPITLSRLALDHAVSRQDIRRARNHLTSALDDVFYHDAAAQSAVTAADKELDVPTEWQDLISRHPWLAVPVSDHHSITALQLLLGLRWHDALHSTWLFDDQIDDCVAATLEALQLEPQQVMTLTTARRCLSQSRAPAPTEEPQLQRWLAYCGLHCQSTQHGWTVCLHPTYAVTFNDQSRVGAQIENETPHYSLSLSHAISRLSELLHAHHNDATERTVGEILAGADQAQGELGQLARAIRDAVAAAPGTWTLGTGTRRPALRPATPQHDTATATAMRSTLDSRTRLAWLHRLADDLHHLQTTRQHTASPHHSGTSPSDAPPATDNEARALWLRTLQEDTYAVLLAVRTAMPTAEIAARLQRKVRLRTLRDVLGGDPQVMAVGQDSWTLALLPPEEAGAHPNANPQLNSAVVALTSADRPLSTAELKGRARLGIQSAYLKQKLDADPRFQRSTKDNWALTGWGLPVYKPMKELVGDMIDRNGGAISAEDVIRQLLRDFGIKEASLRQVMSSPPFTARGGVVRRLAEVEAEHARTTRIDNPAHDDAPTADDLIEGLGLI
ncbi:hypothetical protein [[Kitasatospora] papulosa]|uniref:hypothetical protein n=1 Tax=[Kitasatospora] papulosa TaxID=1464011 RepID=UPI00362FD85E